MVSRIFVEETIYEQFKKDFISATKKLVVGHPSEGNTKVGALVSKPHLEKVLSYVKLAQKEGATLLCGGEKTVVKGYEEGYYMLPTILEIQSNDCSVNQEEIFGPVVTIMPFKSEDEVIEMANTVRYGLSATVWTNNLKRTLKMTQEIEAGIVWVNTWMLRDLRTPFGGVKDSGVGRRRRI